MPLFDHFDFLAPIYDRAIPFKGLNEWLIHLDPTSDGKMLDIGGGTGRVASVLQSHLSEVVVLDISSGMLVQARKKGLSALQGYSEALCFADNSFERIIMVDAFHHIVDGRKTLAEMWRVLKPGGKIVIHEPDIRVPIVWIVAVVEKLALMRSHFVSPPVIKRILEQLPNSNVNVETDGYTAWIVAIKTS